MLSLVMDTSNQYLMVALYENDQRLDVIQELGSKKQSENAIPYLELLLKKHNKELLDVNEVIITRGPGSYTGVRVAMTIAKTLSVISDIQIKVISSLQAYTTSKQCVSVIDARSKKIFVCAYNQDRSLCDEQLILIDEFDEFMQQYKDFDVVGQSQIVNYPIIDTDLADNMYRISKNIEPIEYIDALVPVYIKDVEAKKICL